jgi:hypothetical protein
MEPEIDLTTAPLGPDICPKCGQPTWTHDKERRQYICIDGDCGWAEEIDATRESIWAKLVRITRIKR